MSGLGLQRAVAVAIALLSAGGVIVGFAFPTQFSDGALVSTLWPIPNIVVGVLLTLRRPHLVTGWIFAAIGFLAGTGSGADALASRAFEAATALPWWGVLAVWYGEWYWLPMIYTTLILLPSLFPTGRPLPGRWRALMVFTLATLGVATVAAALQESLDAVDGWSVRNPIGIAGLGDVEDGALGGFLALVTVICLVGAAASLVIRFRRSRGVERQQLKWFTSAGVCLIVGFISLGVADAAGFERPSIIDSTLFSLPPIAAGIAISRYRLYAIDRIISRTVTYFLVTALLVGVYAGAVAVMSAVLGPLAGESPLAVAVATLAAAAVFRPALGRIQRAVDRRFNRARYDARRTLDGFRDRVRSDVDLDRLCADLVAVTDDALQPATAAVWLRSAEAAT